MNAWLAPSVGAALGAAAQPVLAYFALAIDQHDIGVPEWLDITVVLFWWILSLPGGVVAGRGYLTLIVMMAFWGALGALVGTLFERARRDRDKLEGGRRE
jgi:hypothetical protein